MLDPHARLKGYDLSDKVGTVQLVAVRIAVREPSQLTVSVWKVELGPVVWIDTMYPVIGEPPVKGADQEIMTSRPLITVEGTAG